MNMTALIPSYRNPDYLDICLRSLTDGRSLPDTKIMIVVDGFPEESRDVLNKYKNISVVELESNMGMQYALNVGVMNARTELIFIANDDNVFPDKWDAKLLEAWETTRSVHIFSDAAASMFPYVLTANQIEPDFSTMFNFIHKDFGRSCDNFQYEEFIEFEKNVSVNETIREGGNIFPFLIEKKWYMIVGGFDTWYNSPQVCDWDFFLKLELAGVRSYKTKNVHLYHFGSKATKLGKEGKQFREKEENAMKMFYYKWGAPLYNEPKTNRKIPPDRKFGGFTA